MVFSIRKKNKYYFYNKFKGLFMNILIEATGSLTSGYLIKTIKEVWT